MDDQHLGCNSMGQRHRAFGLRGGFYGLRVVDACEAGRANFAKPYAANADAANDANAIDTSAGAASRGQAAVLATEFSDPASSWFAVEIITE